MWGDIMAIMFESMFKEVSHCSAPLAGWVSGIVEGAPRNHEIEIEDKTLNFPMIKDTLFAT